MYPLRAGLSCFNIGPWPVALCKLQASPGDAVGLFLTPQSSCNQGAPGRSCLLFVKRATPVELRAAARNKTRQACLHFY